jgi:hypothetical protein
VRRALDVPGTLNVIEPKRGALSEASGMADAANDTRAADQLPRHATLPNHAGSKPYLQSSDTRGAELGASNRELAAVIKSPSLLSFEQEPEQANSRGDQHCGCD